jgi:hypothetical protein
VVAEITASVEVVILSLEQSGEEVEDPCTIPVRSLRLGSVGREAGILLVEEIVFADSQNAACIQRLLPADGRRFARPSLSLVSETP